MTTPGGYSAGTIWLAVMPSFAGFQDRVRKEAKAAQRALDDEQRKQPRGGSDTDSRRRAAQRGKADADAYAGKFAEGFKRVLQGTQRDLKAIQIDVDVDDAVGRLETVRSHIDNLQKRTIGVDLDADSALDDLVAMRGELEALQSIADKMDIGVDVDLGAAIAQMTAFEADVERLRRKKVEIPVEVERKSLGAYGTRMAQAISRALAALPDQEIGLESSAAEAKLAVIRARLEAMDGKEIKVGADTRAARAVLEALEVDLKRIAMKSVDAEVIVNATKALAELRAVDHNLDKIDGRKARIDVNSGQALRAFNGLLLTAVTLLPLIVPAAIAAAGALAAIAPAALAGAVGLGVLIAGFTGIGDAVSALSNQQKNGAKEAAAQARSLRTAAKGVRDAEQGLVRARRDSAASAESSAARVRDALESQGAVAEQSAKRMQQALRRQRDAERSLQDAQKDAKRAQDNLTQARAEASQQLEDLELRLRGGVLAERQALVDLFEATVSYNNTMADGGATNLEREQASIALEEARLRIESVRLENKRMGEEEKKVAKGGVESSERVVAAKQAVEDANRRIADAEEGVRDASAGVAETQQENARAARDAARAVTEAYAAQSAAAVSNAEAVRDAQERVGDAMAAYRESATTLTATQVALNDAMGKLGPAGQSFARFLFNEVLPGLREMRTAIQEGLLPGVESMMRTLFGTYGPQLMTFMGEMGTVFGQIFRDMGVMLTNPAWQAFFDMMFEYTPIFTQLWAELGGEVLTILAQLLTAFAPLGVDMMKWLIDGAKALSDFLASAEGQKALSDFMETVRRVGPKVVAFLGAFVGALFNLGRAIAPYAEKLLDAFTGFLNFIEDMDPKTLGTIVVGILALTFALQLFLGIATLVQAFFAIGALLMLPYVGVVALVILVVFALAAAFVILWRRSETFRDVVTGIIGAVGKAVTWLWEKIFKPVLGAIVSYVRFVLTVWSAVFDLLWKIFKVLIDKAGEAWDKFTKTGMGRAIVWFFDEVVKPAWSGFLSFVQWLWEQITKVFSGNIKIGIALINEGLIDPFNWLAEKFGSKKIPRIAEPREPKPAPRVHTAAGAASKLARFATGGMVGGFSATPTADNIPAMLTAGEFVLPVRAVRALRAKLGPDFLEMLRRGLPGYADGGLVAFGRLLQQRGFRVSEHPLFGGVRPVHAKNSQHYSGAAIDVNWAAGTSPAEMKAIDAIVGMAEGYGLRTIWRSAGHFNHAHFDEGGGSNIMGKIGSALGAVGGAIKDAAGNVIGAPLNWLRGRVNDAASRLPHNALGDLIGGGLRTLLDAAIGKLVDEGAAVGDFFTRDGQDAPPQGYARGGEVKLYDSGGWLQPGLTTVLNASGRPEPVFSAQQWEKIEPAIGGGGGPLIGTLQTQTGATPGEIAHEVLFATRHISRGGVHADRKAP